MTIYSVSNVTDLYSALKLAVGGDRIELQAGHYDHIQLKDKYSKFGLSGELNYDSPVTITSADPENPAIIGSIDLQYANNMSFDNLAFNGENPTTGGNYADMFFVARASNISVTNSTFVGDATVHAATKDDLGNGGFTTRDSSGITFSGNEVSNLGFGTAFWNITDLTVTNNNLHDIQGDFMRLPGTINGVISGNTFSNHLGAAEPVTHSDYIQFWTNVQTRGAEDVTISGNTFLNGEHYAQAIFMRNEYNDTTGGAHPEDHYKNITIEDNVILNGHSAGISIGYVDGIVIRNNSFIDDDSFADGLTDGMAPSISVANGTGVEIYNNIVPGSINTPNSEVLANEGNFFTNDVFEHNDNYTGKLFLNSFDTTPTLEDLLINPDSPLVKADGTVYGSQRLLVDQNPEDLTALILKQPLHAESPTTYQFNAGLSANSDGFLQAQDARFVWDFGDGTTGEGFVVNHTYVQPGDHNVTLTVIHKDGSTDSMESLVSVKAPLLVDLDFSAGGVVDVSSYNSSLYIKNPDGLVQADNGFAYQLADRANLDISRGNSQIFNHDQLTIDMVVSRDQATTGGGEVFRIHGSMIFSIGSDGTLQFRLTNSDDVTFIVKSNIGVITDTAEHRITLSYDSYQQTLNFYVDGQNAGSAHMEGLTKVVQSWGLSIGNPFGGSFDGLVHDFKMYGAALTQDQILNGYSLGDQAVTEVVVPNMPGEPDVIDVPDEPIEEPVDEPTDTDSSDDEETDSSETDTSQPDPVPAPEPEPSTDLSLEDIAAMSGETPTDPSLHAHGVEGERFYATNGDDVILGTDNNDTIWARDGEDIVFGGAGDDFINAFGHGIGKNFMSGGEGNDVVSGANDKDILLGDAGDDRLLGRGGDDILIGGAGKDYLQGGDGNDVLYGGAGKDTYQGGAGDDIFVFSNFGEADSIYDFELGHDKFNVGELLDELNLSVSPDEILDVFSVKVTNEYWNHANLLMNVNGEDHVIAHFNGAGVGQITMQALIDTDSIMLDVFTVSPDML